MVELAVAVILNTVLAAAAALKRDGCRSLHCAGSSSSIEGSTRKEQHGLYVGAAN
jgi:hypothetical protein